MKRIILALVLSLSLLLVVPITSRVTADQAAATVHFSPNGGCTDAIVKEINTAKKSILVQADSTTFAPIAEAPVNAHKRGIKVEAILG